MAEFPGIDAAIARLGTGPATNGFIVGYSGGMDSHVLLHRLAAFPPDQCARPLAAVYVDHGLQTASIAWGEHCAGVCRSLKVPFQVLKIDAQAAPGESPEAVARRARYAAFAAVLESDAALLTAHHRDDQAETLLLQLLRGAGPHGLAAMPAVSRLGQGWLLRPVLDVDHAELHAYAKLHGLRWIEDASNHETRFDRNYLRHRVWPLLQERWPAATRTLARSAQLCAEAAQWLDEVAAADLAVVVADRPDGLWLPALRALDERRQRQVLRYWLRQLQLPVPDTRQLRQLLQDVLTAAADRSPCSHWPGAEVRRYREKLYARSPLPVHDAGQRLVWRSTAAGWPPLELPGIGWLHLRETLGAGLRAEALAGASLVVGFRQGGERFRPVGRRHHQELKKLMQEAGIPPWERARLPLLYGSVAEKSDGLRTQISEGPLLAVVGLGLAADWSASPGETGWQPELAL